MDLRQLESFIAVAEEGSFTRAAHHIHLAQSGVSAHIKGLETELRQQLFERTPRRVRLTAAGAALLPHARTAMSALAAGKESVDALTGLLHGHVAVGAVPSISPRSIDLPEVLASFRHEYPGVTISLVEDTAARLLFRIREGTLDVAFTSFTGQALVGVGACQLHEERSVLAFLPSDPLADKAEVALDELDERPLLVLPEGAGLRWQLDQALARKSVQVNIAIEAGGPDVLITMAEKGLGVALVPESALVDNGLLCGVRVAELPPGLLGLIWRNDSVASPAARVFVEHTVESAVCTEL
ncbi:LysR family transcriptional regulator [Rhodococcus erythropolis]|uniref:LysR family transcriptional regulator n=1 Tax=Rhodococcus erythropolis TaxID=1833 RepID=UPI001BE8E1C5|nr:LysR family transcriptional regulator [Rhodococcus erythropolis]MBT2269003.1 LysR family transcriptional regulator [Rhodococcus erythropolis]